MLIRFIISYDNIIYCRDAVVLYLEQLMIGCRCLILGQSTAIRVPSRNFVWGGELGKLTQ